MVVILAICCKHAYSHLSVSAITDSMSSLPLNPTKSLPSFSDTTSSSSSKRDELMDVGTEFMTTNSASSKSSHPPASDTSAGQMPPDSTAAYQVFTMMVWGLLSNVHISNVIIFL